MSKVIATRLDPAMIAKARDGLIAKGYESEQLTTISNIVRLTFFYGLAELLDDPNVQVSAESQAWIAQKINQDKSKQTLSMEDLIK